jgi:hypothetical protein
MLFKTFLIPKILKKIKTETRRLVKYDSDGEKIPCRYKVGHQYYVDHKYYQKDHDGRIKVLQVREERISQITPAGVKSEGFESGNVGQFIAGFKEINKEKEITEADPLVWVITFDLMQ